MDTRDEEHLRVDQSLDSPEESPRESDNDETAAVDDRSRGASGQEPAGKEEGHSGHGDPRDEILLDGEQADGHEAGSGDEDGGGEKEAPRRFRRTILILSIFIVGSVLLAAGVIGYHAKVTGIFSAATMGLYESTRGDGTGRNIETGMPGDPGQATPRRFEFERFILHVGVEHGPDRIIYYDLALEMPGDRAMDESENKRMRTLIYRASRELVSEADLAGMPSRTARRELGRRILEATRADSVMAVYFTRFVMI